MKGAFNGKCDSCGEVKAGCAHCWLWRVRGREKVYDLPRVWCLECRNYRRGSYRLDARHK